MVGLISTLAAVPYKVVKGSGLTDYTGNVNPLVFILLILFICMLIFSAIGYCIWVYWRRLQFNKMLMEDKFSNQEERLLRSYIDRTHVKDPLETVTNYIDFQRFADNVAKLYLTHVVSIDLLRDESVKFAAIREKLGFTESFDERFLGSSRVLPVGYMVTVTAYDAVTDMSYQWYSNVLENQEFYLSLSLPENPELRDSVIRLGKPTFELFFARKRDKRYYYEAHLVSMQTGKRPACVITHSSRLDSIPLQQPLGLRAKATCTVALKEGEEPALTNIRIIIASLDGNGCFFQVKKNIVELDNGQSLIILFKVSGTSYSLRAYIEEVFDHSDGKVYQAVWRNLKDEERQALIVYASKAKK